MKLNTLLPATLLCALGLLTACATTPAGPMAGAKLEARSDSAVRGIVSFKQDGDKVVVYVDATGIVPGDHGFHIHEVGDCSAPDASSAKGHFNPSGGGHGHHAGDMPNMTADGFGTVRITFVIDTLTLTGPNSIIGRSVILHADPDDYRSQPAGNSGKRIACGVILPV
jgi:Cu-Zn family superoxide dismutase